MSQGALPGFRDFYPEQLAERNFVVGVWRDVARRYAFVEYDGPPLESLDLYTRKSGDEIVGQLYNFTDKGDREVALRPEMTPTLARMVGARANALHKPVRWFSIPQLFRYERQQKGRLREHFQLNVDIIGEAGPAADAELLAAAIEVMRAFGLTSADVRAKVSDRKLLSLLMMDAGVSAEQLPPVYQVLDKLGREPANVTREKWLKAVGDDDVVTRIEAVVACRSFSDLQSRYANSASIRPELERFGSYLAFLDALGVSDWIEFDLSIVRGLAYYTGTVFELFDAKGEFRAICGGGRYDTLLSSLGAADLPALGFGMGDVVLTELLRARGLLKPDRHGIDFWVAATEDALIPDVVRLAQELRAAGASVEYALRPQALGKQFKAAGTIGARHIVVMNGDDVSRGTVSLRSAGDSRDAQPSSMPRSELLRLASETTRPRS